MIWSTIFSCFLFSCRRRIPLTITLPIQKSWKLGKTWTRSLWSASALTIMTIQILKSFSHLPLSSWYPIIIGSISNENYFGRHYLLLSCLWLNMYLFQVFKISKDLKTGSVSSIFYMLCFALLTEKRKFSK